MTKLSDIRADHDLDQGGAWFHWRGTIYLKVRRFNNRAYHRALRRTQLENPTPGAEASAEEKAAHEEHLGRALVPAVAEHVLVGWWGMDAEVEPIEIEGAPDSTLVASVDDTELRSLEIAGRVYRPDGALWQEMEPYSTARAAEVLADPRCADLLEAVRTAAHILDVRRIREDVAAVGKLRSTSAGTSSSATALSR